MRLLVVVPTYPHPGHPFSGVFNERSVGALNELCNGVEVLVPRPYVPPLVSSCLSRWKMHALTPSFAVRNGINVYRPAYLQIPKVGGAFWLDLGAYLFCRSLARRLHKHARFDAILSFDLVAAGGLAWRLGEELKIPAGGWATGGDLNFLALSSYGQATARALRRLDIVFYQSHDLLKKAATLLGSVTTEMSPERHIVLPRGISIPGCLSKKEMRQRLRVGLGIANEQVLVLYVGRISREKGAYDLINAISLALAKNPKIVCIMLGSLPAFDETTAVQKYLDKLPAVNKLRIVAACAQENVWEYLSAADIFVFPSHREGMPNSLLEAMVMGVPSVAFAIPPVLEIEAGTRGLALVPPFDSGQFAEEILTLAARPDERSRIGKIGRQRVMEGFIVKNNMAEAIRRLTTKKYVKNIFDRKQSA